MRKLKSQMQKILNGVCPNVYFENAPDNASMPYMVYDLTEGNYNSGQIIYFMDVDVWDKGESSKRVDDLCSKLRKMSGTTFIDDDVQFVMYFDRVVNSKSESKNWKRKTAIFQVRTIERS